jgi:hypothetical protein
LAALIEVNCYGKRINISTLHCCSFFFPLLIHFLVHLSLSLLHQSQTTIKSNIPRNKIKCTHKQKSQTTIESKSTETWTTQTQFNIIKIKPKSLSNAKSILQEGLLTKSSFYSLTKKTQNNTSRSGSQQKQHRRLRPSVNSVLTLSGVFGRQ